MPAAAEHKIRSIVKDRLCNFATGILIQLALSTTSDPTIVNSVTATDAQEESQYCAIQAKIANRVAKPSYDPLEMKLRSRHVTNSGASFRSIRFLTAIASTKQLGRLSPYCSELSVYVLTFITYRAIILRLLDLLTDGLDAIGPCTLR